MVNKGAQRKATTKRIYVNQVRDRSPIIGVKLADNRRHLKIEDLKKDHSASLHKKQAKQRTKEQLGRLNEQIQQLQLEINKHKQMEVRLEQQVTELTTANEKLRQNTVVSIQTDQFKKQQSTKVSTSDNKLEQKITEHKQVKQQARQEIGELTATKKQSKRRINPRKQSDRMFREKTEQARIPNELKEQPLDVEKLKAMAVLAKQIQGRTRHK